MTVHQGKAYIGEHEAIVSRELWDQVQLSLAERTQGHSRRMKAKEPSLLVGLLVDGEGRAMTPSHAVKGKVRYRYYITRPDLTDGTQAWRVSAHDLERLVAQRLSGFLADQHELFSHIGKLGIDAQSTDAVIQSAAERALILREGAAASRMRLIARLTARIELQVDEVIVRLDASTVMEVLGLGVSESKRARPIVLRCPATKVWHGRQLRLVIPGLADKTGFRLRSPGLIRLMADVQQARHLVLANADKTLSAVARDAGRCRVRLKELLRLACLSPDIVTAILEGRQPVGLSNTKLLNTPLPLDWQEQRTLLGFA